MTEDKFEKELARKILELRAVSVDMTLSDVTQGRLIAMEHTLNDYRAFKAEQSTAPASLVERLNKWSEGCYGYTDNPSKCPAMDEFEKIIREAEAKARQYLMGLQDKEGR